MKKMNDMGNLEKLRELLIKKNNLIDKMLFITRSIEINVEEDIDSYIEMVDSRVPIVEELSLVDSEISSILDNLEEMTDEISGLVASTNMTISKVAGEIIEAENLLLAQIEHMGEDLKKEAKTIVEGKTAKALYHKEFDQKSRIDIRN